MQRSNALYVLVWPAPLAWDDALADNDTDVIAVLRAITQDVESKKGMTVPIGLWGASFGRFEGIWLNEPAKLLLGVDSLNVRQA